MNSELIPYLLIPFLTALVGWSTNWVGVKMMLYPAHWVGVGGFIGWQGIIPRMRERLTRLLIQNSVTMVCTPKDIIEAMDEQEAVDTIAEIIDPQIELWIDDIMEEHGSSYWALAPKSLRRVVYDRVREAGAGEAIRFDFPSIRAQPNTFDSHRVIRWAGEAGLQEPLVEELFHRYFVDGQDLGDHNVLMAAASAVGLDAHEVGDWLADVAGVVLGYGLSWIVATGLPSRRDAETKETT